MSNPIAMNPKINLTKFILSVPSKITYKVEKNPPVKSKSLV